MKSATQQTPGTIDGNAIRLMVEFTDHVEGVGGDPTLHRSLSTARSDFRCPHCDSIIYSRRHKLCGVCGRTLPADLLFSPEEARRIERLLQTD